MKRKIKGFISAFVGCIVSVTSMPVSDANAVTEITAEQLKSVQNFILGNSGGITTDIDKTFDVNNDDRIDVFDLCMLKKAYAEQLQKTDSFYSMASEMVNENDSKYGAMIMSDEFHSKRVIAKTDTGYDFSGFSPKKVINGPENLYVLQFETVENAELCINTLRKDSHIEYVELDEYMSCEEIETEQVNSDSWGVKAIEADKYSEYLSNNADSSVVVAVVDTGVAYHDFLKDRVLDTGYDLVDNDPNPNDKHFHGTHVAGTVVDCTPDLNINIMPVRVLDENGNGSVLNVGNGIRFAAENGADVINLSLGGHGCSEYIDDSIEYAVENGVTVVVAAGNKGDDTVNYCPAHLDDCIVVSACDSENNKANFSNYGNSVDVTAPGVDIRSCIPGGSYKQLSGTSMATPHISATVAMIKYADKNATPTEIEQKIKDISLDLGDVGKDVYYGYGLPKLSKLIESNIVDSGKCGDNVYYTLDENGLLTISGTGKMTDFSNSISTPWYEYRENIKKVNIKDGVTSIGGSAFAGCSGLTSITIPYSVKFIKGYTFEGCSGLTSVTIPDSVTGIGDFAFCNCTALTSIDIPNSVISIQERAFAGCSGLTSVTIPDSVTSIRVYAFYGCTKLESIKILNPECEINDSEYTINDTATIYGYTGSTAQAYAEKYGRNFESFDIYATLSVWGSKTYETVAEIEDFSSSDSEVAVTVMSARKTDLVITALQEGYTDIVVKLTNGDVYTVHLTVK